MPQTCGRTIKTAVVKVLLLLLLLSLPTPPTPPPPSQITTNAAPNRGSGSKHVTCDRCVNCDHPWLRCTCYTLWCGFVINASKTVQWDDQSRTV